MKTLVCCAALVAGFVAPSVTHAASEYTPGVTYGTADQIQQVSSVAVGRDDFLVVASGGKVFLFDPAKEQSVRSFDSGFDRISAVAVQDGKIYVFARKTETRDREYNGRKFKVEVPIEALCKTFSWEGAPLGELKLEDLKDVTNAKVIDGKIYVSDFGGTRTVRTFDAATGKSLTAFGKDLRLCCGILDFAVEPKTGDVLIPNLGAFRLERYSRDGGMVSSFGKRGDDVESFQGCCNPVSAGVLPDGNLVVAEKDPSRVKVYTPDGKMIFLFKDLQELTKGCNQVSVAVDSHGRVYLGAQRLVLQYVPKA